MTRTDRRSGAAGRSSDSLIFDQMFMGLVSAGLIMRKARRLHEIKAGTLYAMNNHDRHRIRAITRIRVICTFVPPLTSDEVHDADGSL